MFIVHKIKLCFNAQMKIVLKRNQLMENNYQVWEHQFISEITFLLLMDLHFVQKRKILYKAHNQLE